MDGLWADAEGAYRREILAATVGSARPRAGFDTRTAESRRVVAFDDSVFKHIPYGFGALARPAARIDPRHADFIGAAPVVTA
jgi:hypothetical protein